MMHYVEVYLGLGSNKGDRSLHLKEAVSLLEQGLAMPCERQSSIVESASWGFSGGDFLNSCVLFRLVREKRSVKQAQAILRLCKKIEREMGREPCPLFDAEGKRVYRDRLIDIDVLLFGTERIQTAELVVPHPLMGQRPFVMEPLQEIISPGLRAAFPDIFPSR